MCAAALAPVVAAGVAVGPVVLAGVGVVGSVGANVLTDVVMGVVDRLRGDGAETSQAAVEAELAARLEEALEGAGESAQALREAVAALLRGVDAVGAVVEAAAARDRELLPVVVEGFAGLGERFGEFAFVIDDVRRAVWEIEGSLRQQQAVSRVEQERAREHGLTLLRVLEAVERGGVNAAGPEGVVGRGDPVWSGCPYVGLVPFEERDARVFYGRSELVGQLVQRLGERLGGKGMLLMVGASGAGKSSLLRAGMMPRLAAGALGPGSGRWPRRVMRPTGSPLRELAMHLADVAGVDSASVRRSLSAAPGDAPLLVEQAVRAATGLGPDARRPVPDDAVALLPRLVLVVDQFEELFTAGVDTDAGRVEREAFVAALHAAATVPVAPGGVPGALVVVAVRADFLDRTISYPPLAAALDAGPFPVGPMSEAELRLAITGPAAEAGLTVEAALVEAVVSELRGEGAEGGLGSGVLPLVSQAMAATWERREGDELSVRAYRRVGGVADAVNRGAQAAYDTLTSRQRDAARVVFTRLTVITPDGQLARHRCRRTDLHTPGEEAGEIDAVIDIFGARRLLVLGEDSVEISHDVLLHAWKQLRVWLGGDQLDRALYSQVVTDAQTWDTNRREPSYLYRSGRLAAIDAALVRWENTPTRYPPLPSASAAFLHAAHRAAHRTTRRRRAVIAGLLALALTAIAAAGIAAHNATNATRQHAIALSRQLAAESLAIDPTQPITARRLAVAAWRVFPTDQARSVIATLLTEQQQNGILPADPSNVSGVAFSPDGKLLASADSDGTVRLWNPVTGQPVGTPLPADTGTQGSVNGVAFSPDGKLLASADSDGTVRLWNPVTGQPVGLPLPAGAQGSVNGVAFSPDGKLLASADSDGTVRLWEVSLFADPYATLCADVGAPTKQDWEQYASGEPQPSVCV
jgi:WD domain, G-beta repeat